MCGLVETFGQAKWLFIMAIDRHLPQGNLYHPKQLFAVPLD